ncbi:Phospholipid/glycerol acyltransferase [Penicillium lividum]|nr:Phospholipid/glycerol acyltransferase [Penicillium lividum]
MDSGATGDCPSLPWRTVSNMTMWGVAGLCRAFLSGLCNAEAHGAEAFTELLDSRRDPSQRTKGLITVSNHISVYVSFNSLNDEALPYISARDNS